MVSGKLTKPVPQVGTCPSGLSLDSRDGVEAYRCKFWGQRGVENDDFLAMNTLRLKLFDSELSWLDGCELVCEHWAFIEALMGPVCETVDLLYEKGSMKRGFACCDPIHVWRKSLSTSLSI